MRTLKLRCVFLYIAFVLFHFIAYIWLSYSNERMVGWGGRVTCSLYGGADFRSRCLTMMVMCPMWYHEVYVGREKSKLISRSIVNRHMWISYQIRCPKDHHHADHRYAFVDVVSVHDWFVRRVAHFQGDTFRLVQQLMTSGERTS